MQTSTDAYTGQQSTTLLALRCFTAWLKLDVSGSGGALLPADQLYSQHRQLFSALLSTLTVDDAAVLEEAAEGLTLLLGALSRPQSSTCSLFNFDTRKSVPLVAMRRRTPAQMQGASLAGRRRRRQMRCTPRRRACCRCTTASWCRTGRPARTPSHRSALC